MSDPAARIAAELGASNGQVRPEDLSGWVAQIDWAVLWSEEVPVNDWAIEPLLPAGRHVALWSRAKVGKSLLVLDAVAAVVTGRKLLGGPAIDPVDVVYIDMEMGPDDLRGRLESLGYGPDSDLSRLHYYQGSGFPPLDTPLGGEVVEAVCRRWNARIVVIDTMARAVTGEENSADTYRRFYEHTGRRLRALGVSVLRLDHGGKDHRQGQRGSSAKDDDADVVLELLDQGEQLVLRRTRSRVDWVPAETRLRRESEPLLRHLLMPVAYDEGTREVADALDELAVSLTASRREASAALKGVGQGKRDAVVAAALKYRRRQR